VDLTPPRIQRLPEDLVNKIAAGEVVERPASVVKELVENALDAGAGSVSVEIESGGKSLVRVRDDGCGMGREDARLAVERHATSKLRSFADLQSLATHGFRGEALPSMASVAHLVLRTRADGEAAGTEVEVRHGKLVHVRDAGHPRGTTVEVRDLFGAVPARRKFLRADATEAAHVAEVMTQLALARPGTGFRLSSGGRAVLEAPPVDGLAARIYQVLGGEALEDLLPVEGERGWMRVSGFVSRPDRPAPARPSIRLFVNGRSIRDRALARAVAEAYRASGAGDRRADAILFLAAPPHLVDVNVHPAKSEVRFADARAAFDAVLSAVRDALGAGARREAPRADTSRVAEAVERYLARETTPRAVAPERPTAAPGGAVPGLLEPAAATVLGQHRNTYIVATDGEDLLVVDQHTAHERVRYEAVLERLERGSVESQALLAPLVFTLSPRLRPVLEAQAEALTALGFDVERFGGDAVRVRSTPAILGARDAGRALGALLADFVERESGEWAVSGARERLAATLACHSAVRAGDPLQRETMAAIVRDLARARHPTLCPHGRPTTVRIPREEVSRWFGRSGWRRE
jgi:DNA mismatch repair protein MutL